MRLAVPHMLIHVYTVFYASISFSPTLATSPIRPLKPFFKDVEPTVKNPLGTGCYGSVVEVRCKSTGGVYAAKKFRGDFVKERNFEKKFNTEFGLLHQLEHEHIVCYIGFTILQDSDFPALLMEQLDTNLHAHLEYKVDIPLAEKMYILLGVGKGLEYLHKKDVLHRDLTARNILLNKSDGSIPPIPKIADFGNSHVTNINPMLELESVCFPGTPLYQPPEACTGCYDHKLDIFSFGHLSLFVCTQNFPRCLLPSKYVAYCTDGTKKLLGRSEVEKRKEYFDMLRNDQYCPIIALMQKCLNDIPDERPSASEVVCELNQIRAVLGLDDVDSPNDREGCHAPVENDYHLQRSDSSMPDIN